VLSAGLRPGERLVVSALRNPITGMALETIDEQRLRGAGAIAMDRLIAWWVHNPVAANLLMVGILLAGLMGFLTMEREAFPQVKPYQAQIEVIWPGAAPQEVEEQIIVRIEQALEDLDEVNHVYSTAMEGMAEIEVTTYPNVDINGFLNDVKNAVDSVTSLPRDIENPRVRRTQFRQEMIRVAVHGRPQRARTDAPRRGPARRGGALPWVSTIELFGTRREEVTIELSEASMRRYGLSASARSRRHPRLLRQPVLGTGAHRDRRRADPRAQPRGHGTGLRSIIVRQATDGGSVRVGDVARVIDGFEDNEILATMNGEPAVLLQVQSTDNMQVVKASEAVRSLDGSAPRQPARKASS
jgi:multidrug efflux pump subunit AcrB